jgi:hypothetical protein
MPFKVLFTRWSQLNCWANVYCLARDAKCESWTMICYFFSVPIFIVARRNLEWRRPKGNDLYRRKTIDAVIWGRNSMSCCNQPSISLIIINNLTESNCPKNQVLCHEDHWSNGVDIKTASNVFNGHRIKFIPQSKLSICVASRKTYFIWCVNTAHKKRGKG